MDEQKLSRKALRTMKIIRGSLAEYLEEKELKDITVQEIADKAGISRTTFYNYYMDVYDIYEQTERDILSDLEKIVTELGLADEKEMFGAIFNNIEENPEIFKMIFSPNTTSHLCDKLGTMLEVMCIKVWLARANKDVLTDMQRYLIHYHVQGSLAIVAKWSQNNYREPKELIIKAMTLSDQAAEKYIMGENQA